MDRPRQLLAQYPPDIYYDANIDVEEVDWNLEWETFLEDVQENVMKPCLPEEGFIVVVATNVGWRNNHGWKIFPLDGPKDFVRKVSGFTCDQTIEFYVDETMQVTARIAHHDSPTGEGRSIVPLREWIAREIGDLSMEELHANLTWIEIEENAQGWKDPDDYYLWEIAAKKNDRNSLTKEDFAAIYEMYFEEDFLSDVDVFNLEGYIYKYHADEEV